MLYQASASEGTGGDIDQNSDFFDEVDPTSLGRKDCTNQQEVTDCVADCEADKDCTQVAQESLCEQVINFIYSSSYPLQS